MAQFDPDAQVGATDSATLAAQDCLSRIWHCLRRWQLLAVETSSGAWRGYPCRL